MICAKGSIFFPPSSNMPNNNFGYRGRLVGVPFSLVTSETSKNTPLLFCEAVAWRLEVTEAVPAQSSAGRRWNPSGFRAWGARRRGDSHLQSPSAWVNSLQRPTQGPLCLFICTFKGCYITRLNELFNGKDSSELFCLTSWFMQEVQS